MDDFKLDNPDEYKTGITHWFEGEPTFNQIVAQLQAEGKLDRSPYAIPNTYLSVSAVEQYLACPRKFEFRYIKGIRSAPSIALVQGSTVHKALEKGYEHVIRNEALPSLEYCLDSYSTELDLRLNDEVVWEEEDEEAVPKDPGKVKDQGVGLLRVWHREKLPRVKPRKVEASFVTSFGGIPVVGRIDLIDRVESAPDPSSALEMHPLLDVVADNKIVKKTWSKGAADGKLQFSVYAHATGIPRQRVDLFVKTKVPKISEMLTSRDSKQIRWAAKTFVEVAKAISAGIFPPCSPEAWCCTPKFCPYYGICRGAE